MIEFVEKNIESKKVLWFQNTNQFLIVDKPFYDIFFRFLRGDEVGCLLLRCKSKYGLSDNQSKEVIGFSEQLIFRLNEFTSDQKDKEFVLSTSNIDWISYNYCYNFKTIKIQFSSEKLKDLIHLKYFHISSDVNDEDDLEHTIKVVESNDMVFLLHDGEFVGKWTFKDIHFLLGKFSMLLLNGFSNKSDEDWLAVFHASAVYSQNKSILFMGDSGSGKTIAVTMLSTKGYKILADDFVPISKEPEKVYSFPGALSIKNTIYNKLLALFPQLSGYLSSFGNNVAFKYLYSFDWSTFSNVNKECKAIVFIKYSSFSENKISKISKIKALEYLIPDTWIYPNKEHVSLFLDWVCKHPTYIIHYTYNQHLKTCVDELINNEVQ